VTLDIYDILGRKVETLYEGNQQAGEHSVTLHVDGFASGMYFYRLTAGDLTEIKSMLYLK
jgi:hypothetical protein